MMKRTLHKTLSLLLTAAMVLNMGLTPAFAEGANPPGTSGVCTHHTKHTEDCGYQAGTPCSHTHTEECSTKELTCTIVEGEAPEIATDSDAVLDSGAAPADEAHSHSEGCYTQTENCLHEHDDTCGYAPDSPCTFDPASCEQCNPGDKPAEKVCTCEPVDSGEPVHGEDCPLYAPPELSEAVTALIAMVDALPNAADITDENREATLPAYEAAAEACEALSGEDKAVFEQTAQYTKLTALRDVLFAVVPLADSPVTLDITGADNYVEITATGYKVGTAPLIPYTGAYILTGETANTNAPDGYRYTHISVSGGTHNITLNNVSIDVSQADYRGTFVIYDATVDLTLTGENTLKSGLSNAGLQVASNSNVTISGNGSLTAIGKGGAAGIGGGQGGSSGDITINGGIITATGSNTDTTGGGAGIGGGNAGDGATTTITGGKVTATGGQNAAGIGGGSTQGGSGSITIEKGAVVYATKGTGAPNDIGAGTGGSNGSIDLIGGIIFEGNTGNMNSDVTLSDYITVTIGQGQTLNMSEGNDLVVPVGAKIINNGTLKATNMITGSGTYEGNGTLSVALKQYMISPPKNLTYDGTAKTVTVKLLNIEFDSSDYAATYTPDNTNVGTVTPTVTPKSGGRLTGAAAAGDQFTITKGASELGLTTNKTDNTFTYGETITFTAAVSIAPPKTRAALNQVDFFRGGTKLGTENLSGGAGTVTFAYDTTDKGIPAGTLQNITAQYGGSENLASMPQTISVMLNKKPLTAKVNTGDATASKVYDGKNSFANVGLTLSGNENGDTVTATANGTVTDVNVGTGKVLSVTRAELGTGKDNSFYLLPTNLTTITGTVAITPATPTVEVTAEKKASKQRTAIGNHNDTITLNAKVTGVTGGTTPTGTVQFKNGTTPIGTASVVGGVATYDWKAPSAGTSITATAEFTPAANTNYAAASGISNAFGIDKGEQTDFAIIPVTGKKYGDGTFTLATEGSGTGAVSYRSSNTAVLTISGSTATIAGVGNAIITATKASDANFNEATATYEITISKATPTMTWENDTQSLSYTGAEAAIVLPTVAGAGSGTPAVSYAYKKVDSFLFGLFEGYTDGLPKDAGKYEIKAQIAETNNCESANSTNVLKLTITKSTPTVVINTMNGKTYDGDPLEPPTPEQVTITGAAYEDVTFCYKRLNTSVYVEVSPKDSSLYWVHGKVKASDNTEEVIGPDIEVQIEDAPLKTIGGRIAPKKWDGTTTATVTELFFEGLLNGDTLEIDTDYSIKTANYDDADAGTNKKVSGTLGVNTQKAQNYNVQFLWEAKGDITIGDAPAMPAFAAMDDTKGIDTFTFTPTSGYPSVTDYEYSLNDGTSWKAVTENPINVGNQRGNMWLRLKETGNHKAGEIYKHTTPFAATLEGTIFVEGAPVYGETLTASVSGAQEGAVFSYEWFDSDLNGRSPIGTGNTCTIQSGSINKTILVVVTAAGYTGNLQKMVTRNAAKRELPVTANVANKAYDGNTDATVSFTLDEGEIVNGDEVSAKATTTYFLDKNVGDGKTVMIGNVMLEGAAKNYYNVILLPIRLTANITAKTLTVNDEAFAITKEYDKTAAFTADNATGALALEGKVAGETVSVKINRYGTADNANAGTRIIPLEISLEGADKGNYTIASPYSFTKATITAKDITPTIDTIAPVTYDGTAKEPSLTVRGDGTTLTSGTDYTAVYGNNTNAGTNTGSVTVKAAAGGNYAFKDITKNFTINKAPGSVVGVNVTGSYVANDTTFTYTVASIPGAEYKMDSSAWQDSNVFADIVPLSQHTFSARMKETANHHTGEAKDGNAVEFVKLSGVAAPAIAYTVSGRTGSKTIAITAVVGAEYQFGNTAWSDANTKLYTTDETVTIGIRMKETATHEAGEAATASVNLVKQGQTAPAAFALSYQANGEADYTVTIPEVAGCEYSFDGTAYNSTRTKTANAGDTVTGYMRKAETDTHNASPSVSAGVTLPMFTVQAVTATPNGGSFTGSVSVTLTSGTSGAEIYYTTDGSNPTTSSTQYTTAFTLTTNTTIKAIAVKSGMTDSNAESFTFTKSGGSTGGGGNSGGGNSGGGNSGGGSSTTIFNPDKPSSNVNSVTGMVKPNDAAKQTAEAIAESTKANKGTRADVVVRNAKGITPQTLRDMAAAAQKAGGTVQLLADSTVNGKIMARIYINPLFAGNLKNDIQLGVRLDEKSVKYTTDKFSVFDNKLAVISFVHQGELGMQIEVAAKVDLTGLDTNNLHFYSYDKTSNLYYPIAAPAYWIDKNGFLHFKTMRGGDIVITDKPLKLKIPTK